MEMHRSDSQTETASPCANCGLFVDELVPLSLGSVVRVASELERKQRAAIRCTVAARQPTKAPNEAIDVLAKGGASWITLPPVLSRLRSTTAELAARPKILQKEVHVCRACYDMLADAEEVERKRSVRPRRRRSTPHMPNNGVLSACTSLLCNRDPDRCIDMAFSTLQERLRCNDATVREKQQLLKRHIKASAASESKNAGEIDWVEATPSAMNTVPEPVRPLAVADVTAPSPPAQLSVCGHLNEPDNNVDNTDAEEFEDTTTTQFDVPLATHLMYDLWCAMVDVCPYARESTSVEDVPKSDPLHFVYYKGRNRFPSPPTLLTAQPCLDFSVPTVVQRDEATVKLRGAPVGAHVKQLLANGLLRDLDGDESAALLQVVADPTISGDETVAPPGITALEEFEESELDDSGEEAASEESALPENVQPL